MFEKIDDRNLSVVQAYELDAGSYDAIRRRFCTSHLTRDRQIDGTAEFKEGRDATTDELRCLAVGKVYPHTECRDIEDRAGPPLVRRLAFDLTTAHPQDLSAFCPTAIVHDLVLSVLRCKACHVAAVPASDNARAHRASEIVGKKGGLV